MRMVPMGFSRSSLNRKRGLDLLKLGSNSLKEAFACSRGGDLACGPRQQSKPERSSSARMVWLSADCEMPCFAAAFVKLRSRATARKARSSLTFCLRFPLTGPVLLPILSIMMRPNRWFKCCRSRSRCVTTCARTKQEIYLHLCRRSPGRLLSQKVRLGCGVSITSSSTTGMAASPILESSFSDR